MKAKLYLIIKLTILLGTIAVALNILFGENTIIYVKEEQIGDSFLTWYKFNFHEYFINLQTQIEKTTELTLKLPNWRVFGNDWLVNIAYAVTNAVNGILMIVNILIYPLRVGGYIMNFVLAILGLNLTENSGLYWLGQFADSTMNLQINYIGQ